MLKFHYSPLNTNALDYELRKNKRYFSEGITGYAIPMYENEYKKRGYKYTPRTCNLMVNYEKSKDLCRGDLLERGTYEKIRRKPETFDGKKLCNGKLYHARHRKYVVESIVQLENGKFLETGTYCKTKSIKSM